MECNPDFAAFNAVKYGKLYVPSQCVELMLSNSVRRCLRWNEGYPKFPAAVGSGVLLRRGENYFIVCTRHQIDLAKGSIPDESTVRKIVFSRKSIEETYTITNFKYDTQNKDEEFHDLVFFKVDSKMSGFGEEVPDFFLVKGFCKTKRHFSWFVGCPTSYQNYSDDDPMPLITQTIVSRGCCYDDTFTSENRYFRRYAYADYTKPMDGFSGGAVFSMFGDEGCYHIELDGIVTRAGNGYLYAIDADYLVAFLELR